MCITPTCKVINTEYWGAKSGFDPVINLTLGFLGLSNWFAGRMQEGCRKDAGVRQADSENAEEKWS